MNVYARVLVIKQRKEASNKWPIWVMSHTLRKERLLCLLTDLLLSCNQYMPIMPIKTQNRTAQKPNILINHDTINQNLSRRLRRPDTFNTTRPCTIIQHVRIQLKRKVYTKVFIQRY